MNDLIHSDKPTRKPRVVIVGAGFGGLHAARELMSQEVEVIVIDRNNYHGFWPLLYQVATAGLEPESIGYPVRAFSRKFHNMDFRLAEVKGVDYANQQVITNGEPIDYDYLILAAGSANNYFGNTDLAAQTFGLKDIPQAVAIRNRVLTAFEEAVNEKDVIKRAALLTFVIVGGGPTGVELSGAFAELISHVFRKDYQMLDISQARIILVEASGHVLATFPEKLQQNALKKLKNLGVEVNLNKAVARVEDDLVYLKDGSQIAAHTVIWAAGVRSAELSDQLGVEQARAARVKVQPTMQLLTQPNVFVIGDMAYLEGYEGKPQAYPMVAPVAIQQGKLAAKNIVALGKGRKLKTFSYFDKGNMATIGRRAAILDSHGVQLTGFAAWVSWLFVHLLFLVGFRNRLIVFTNWAYNYFTYDRATRLIFRSDKPDNRNRNSQ